MLSLNNQEKECIEYFRQEAVWEKVFRGFRRKYESYGSFRGTVKLLDLSERDIEVLEGFFGKNYHGNKSVSVSAERFRTVLLSSRYGAVTPERILELYFHHKMIGKKEQREQLQKRQNTIIEELEIQYADTVAGRQIPELTQYIKCEKGQDIEDWKKQLQLAADIINHFPYQQGNMMYLAVFATLVTGNPHAFDRGTDGGKLLALLVQRDIDMRGICISNSDVFQSYKRQKSFLEVGIMIDDVSNYAMLYGICAWNKGGKVHLGMEGFSAENDMVQVPLAVIMKWEKLSCPGNKIYIVENPSVYAILCQSKKDAAYMCMNGQPRLASLIVLELLAKSGTIVYYAGDFDPEGLLIAQKLSVYYPGTLHFWHMTKEDYALCRSGEEISQKRLKMLDSITDDRLRPIAQQIAQQKKSGYQEKLKLDEWK